MNIEYKIVNNYRKEKGELEGVKAERRTGGEEENKERKRKGRPMRGSWLILCPPWITKKLTFGKCV